MPEASAAESSLREDREELKRWREARIAALASRRRAYKVLRGDLSSPAAPPRSVPLPVEADEAAVAKAAAETQASASRAGLRLPALHLDEAAVARPERSLEGAEVTPASHELTGVARKLPLDEAAKAGSEAASPTAAEGGSPSHHPGPPQAAAPGDVVAAAASAGGEKLFDHFIVVGLPSRLVEHPNVAIGARYSPKVLHHLSSTDEFLGAEAIADFCLPAGAAVRGAGRAGPQGGEPRSPGALNRDRAVTEVIFVLSGGGRDGSRVQYGLCAHTSRFYEAVDKESRYPLVEADVCYCLITQYPFVPLHFMVLRAAIAAEVAAGERAGSEEDYRRHRARRYAAANATMRDYAALGVPPRAGKG